MQRLRDAAEMLFEPTGDLWKDYCAYCEIEDKSERDDLVDAIHVVEIKPPGAAQSHGDGGSSINISTTTAAPAPAGAGAKVQTHIIARNLDYCLNKRDAMPLANAIPHCQTLTKIQLTGCGITEHSLKLFVEAVYKSPSVVSVALDFNPNGLFKDPTVVAKKDKNEVFVNPAQYRGNHLRAAEELDKKAAAPGAKGAADKGKPADPKAKSSVATVVEETVQAPIPIPTGFHAWLLTGIQQLSLRGNGINDRQVEPLCALLEQNSELLTLSLWGNNITSAGAAGIAKALRNNRRLTALNLGHNQIDDAGAEALAAILLTTDVSNEEAAKLRSRQLRNVPVGADLPAFPTYHDLFIPPPAADADKKDKKPAAAPPKKGKQEGPTEKLKGEFDRDCVRIDDNRVRVPGNTSLWGITLSDNTRITPAAATAFINVLQRREPNYDTGVAYDGVPPSPYAVPSLQLERVDLAHGSMPPEALATLQSALQDFAAYRAAAHSRAPTAQQ